MVRSRVDKIYFLGNFTSSLIFHRRTIFGDFYQLKYCWEHSRSSAGIVLKVNYPRPGTLIDLYSLHQAILPARQMMNA